VSTLRVKLSTRSGTVSLLLCPRELGRKAGLPEQHWENAALLQGAWLALLCDSPLPGDLALKPLRTFKKFLATIEQRTLLGTIASFSTLADKLARSIWSDSNGPDHLREIRRGRLTADLHQEFRDTPVFKEYHAWYTSGDPRIFQFLLTFLRFAKKCEFALEDFNATAFRSWLGVEERLGDLNVNGVEHIPYLAQIVKFCMSPKFVSPTLVGKHGSGAVAGPDRGEFEKSSNFSMTSQLERLYSETFPLGGASEGVMCSYFLRMIASSPKSDSEGTSRLMFVPKNYKTSRSICMEPVAYMFFQQHIRWEIENMLASGILGRFVTIDDQGRNQRGAMYGARTGLVDTIDLSAASDSVHVDLVRALFPEPILSGLLNTRTSIVECPDGQFVHVNKFAPMGSAVCFPVQSIIYASVCIYAYILRFSPDNIDSILSTRSCLKAWLARNVPTDWFSSHTCESFAVYGDDIVVDTRITTVVMSILEELGFSVNQEKSFGGAHLFRESCGVFALDDADVTPFHFKGKAFRGSFGAKEFARFISLANEAGDRNLRHLHSFMINAVLRWKPPRGYDVNPIRFSSNRDDTFAFYSANAHNSHLRSRENENYQRSEVRSWELAPATVQLPGEYQVDDTLYEEYSLSTSYRAAFLRGRNDEYVTPRRVLQGAKIRWGWTSI